jgi:serine/threonine protein kinase
MNNSKVPPYKLIILFLAIKYYISAINDCKTARKLFSAYSCIQNNPIGKGAKGIAFLVEKNKTRYILKVQDISKADLEESALTDLKYLKLFKGDKYLSQLVASHMSTDSLFEILKYGENGDLETFLQKNKTFFANSVDLLGFFLKILKGVETMHSKKVVHADLKVENIVIDGNKDPIIIDFDLSVPINEYRNGRGTYEFMDPVIMQNWSKRKTYYNEYRDVYSLGVILYYLSQGKFPFKGKDFDSIYKKILTHKITFRKKTNTNVIEIVHSCLMINESNRKSIKELIEITRNAIADKEPTLTSEKTIVLNEILEKDAKKESSTPKKSLFEKYLVYIVLGVVLLLASMLILVSMFPRREKTTRDDKAELESTEPDEVESTKPLEP